MLTTADINHFKKEVSNSSRFQLHLVLAKCISDPTCIKILYIVSKSKKVCPSDLSKILGLSLPAVSHQLAKLKKMGIVEAVRHRKMICYFLSDSEESAFVKRLISLIAG